MQCRGMAQSSADLRQIAARTLAHCEQNARSFGEGRRDHDVSQNIEALLKHLEVTAPFDLLDFGCGPGRDLRTFKEMGHGAVGLEARRVRRRRRARTAAARYWNSAFCSPICPRGAGQKEWSGERHGAFHGPAHRVAAASLAKVR